MAMANKLRMTAQRQVILEELRKLKTHPTAGELCGLVRCRLPRISLGTVYRNLEILSREGIIQKLDVGGVEMRFDGETANHYHLRCMMCGRVDDVDMDLIPGIEDELNRQIDFQVTGHRLEFTGICAGCQQAQAANS